MIAAIGNRRHLTLESNAAGRLANGHKAILGPVAARGTAGRLVYADLGASDPAGLAAILGAGVGVVAIAIDDAAIRQRVVDACVVKAGVLGAEVAIVAVGIAVAADRELGVIAGVVRPAAVHGAEVSVVAVRGIHAAARDGLERAGAVRAADIAGTRVVIVAVFVEDTATGDRLLEATEGWIAERLGTLGAIVRAEDRGVRAASRSIHGDDTCVPRTHVLVVA